MADEKIKVSITLDKDVVREMNKTAEAQRTSISALVNQVLAGFLGLIRKPK